MAAVFAQVLVANKDGLVRITAREVIDCTGDGDVAAWSGAPVVKTTAAAAAHAALPHRQRQEDARHVQALQGPTRSGPQGRRVADLLWSRADVHVRPQRSVSARDSRAGRRQRCGRPDALRDASPGRCLGDLRTLESQRARLRRFVLQHQRHRTSACAKRGGSWASTCCSEEDILQGPKVRRRRGDRLLVSRRSSERRDRRARPGTRSRCFPRRTTFRIARCSRRRSAICWWPDAAIRPRPKRPARRG